MGDFDRVAEAPKKAGKKQFVALGGLTVVLLALVTFEFTGKGPQAAQASVNAAAGQDPALASESPAQVIEALRKDPTESLLLPQEQAGPANLALRNPFRMADRWRAALTPASPVVEQSPEVPTAPRAEPTRVAADGYKLMMVSGQTAVINNKVVTAGAVVDGARVLAIRADGVVVLQAADSPDGPKTELRLSAPINR